jgi:hypothetical protein
MSLSRNQINNYLHTIDINEKIVFDVGCGDEKHYAREQTKGKAKQYITFEYDRGFNPTYVIDLNKPLDKDIDYGQADILFCIETLEHIYDPITALKNLNRLCRIDAIMYLTTPFINPLHDTHDYLRYTIQYFEHVLPHLGFDTLEVIPRVATDGKDLLLNFYKSEGLKMSKITQQNGYSDNIIDIGYIVKLRKYADVK